MSLVNRAGAAALAAMALAACNPKGQNLPLEVAKYQVPKPVIAERVRVAPAPEVLPEEPVVIAGRRWQATATEYELPARSVRPIGVADGLDFHVLAWDREPFDRLLVPSRTRPGRWQEFAPVY